MGIRIRQRRNRIAVSFLAIAISFTSTIILVPNKASAEKIVEDSSVPSLEDRGDPRVETGAGKKDKEIGTLPPYIPPPHFARNKHQLPDIILREKREGKYIIPVPMVGIDPDTGFNFGAGVSLFNNGKKSSPFFGITPYKQQISTTVVFSTKSLFQITGYYDHPYLKDTPLRLRTECEFLYNPFQHYFGIGDDSLTLTFPGSPTAYGSYSDYKDALERESNGVAYSRYDEYGYTRLSFKPSLEYDLLGGYIRPLVGFQISKIWVDDYTGNTVGAVDSNGQSASAIEASTHLRDDCDSGRAIGCNGGYDIYVKLGLSFDTRNFEPDPSSGMLFEVVSELSPKFLGSSFNYGKLTTSLKGYGKILEYKKQLIVLASRAMYRWMFGDIPFYSMNILPYTETDRTGLGGFWTLRGYKQDRFVGPAAMLVNAEVRWSFVDFMVLNQYIKLMFVPFFDAGRVFNSASDTTFKNWKVDGGMGIHLSWNLSTVVSLDYGIGSEGKLFYMQLGHQF